MATGYLRYPDVHGDLVVFTADNDLWLVPVLGGRASRLTSDHVMVRNPRFSPNGTKIAWTSYLGQRPEVFVIDLATGDQRRLTWLGAARNLVVGWQDDEHVVFSSPHQTNDVGLSWLYTVSLDGHVERLGYGPGMDLAVNADGAVAVVTPNSGDCSRWKRYRGGTAAQIWLRPAGVGSFLRVLRDGNDDHDGRYAAAGRYGVGWVDGRLLFSSDMSEDDCPRAQAQLWSVDGQGHDLRQHTHHGEDQGYVRDPRTDGRTIVYHAHGALWAMTGLDAEPQRLEIDLGVGAPQRVPLDPTDRLEAVVSDHGGDGSLLEWRGAAYFLTHRSGPARALSAADGVRIREPRVLGQTGQGVWASDVEGEDCLEIANLDGTGDVHRVAQGQIGRVLHMAPAPDGAKVALVSHDGRILIVTMADGAVRQIANSPEGEASGLVWSPDSRYLVWRSPVASGDAMIGQIRCWDEQGMGESFALTRGAFDDSCPVFTADGKYLVMLSARTFDPNYDGQTFDLSFGHTQRPWLVPLSATEVSPFGPSSQGWQISEVQDAKAKATAEAGNDSDKTPEVVCNLTADGFEERMVPFPVPSGSYRGLAAVKDGLVWIEIADRGGELGATRAGVSGEVPSDVLWHYNLVNRHLDKLCEHVDSYSVSGDGERLVVRYKDDVIVVPSSHKVDDDDPACIRVDLSRLRRTIDPRAEWRQMFDENGRLMASHYWREDMNGVDWDGVLNRYRPLVDLCHVVDDLHDILWETVAELNTSHSYVSAAGASGDPDMRAGLLGADVSSEGDGAKVVRVVPGESSDPRAWSPLRAAGVAVADGDVVVAVDGRKVGVDGTLGELLEGSAGRVVELTVCRGEDQRQVAVVPMADEAPLRYHDWVASRRRYVEEHSGGRLGYLHVPDMVSDGWAELHRQINEATSHEGVIADVRFNHGGHTSQLVVERLARKVVGWDFSRWCESPTTYPQNAVRGPIVMVTNQWAGSDGDIVSAVTQAMGYATVVGERSWGGVVGIDGRFDLVDGTSVTQPRYAGWYGDYGWGVENHGVDPDIEAVVSPEDWESDRDIQLDAAIDVCLSELGEHPAATAPAFPAPVFGQPRQD
ncbi:S41 family peptidase [Cutibacterium avidum]|uniref:S41 family peptidase n=1 Tax=Cutibacterium avidum TaxID=33010 RepID=UPI00083E9263|nr:S41 family peptidase [Cutibacterium avidum]AOG28991.1 peptidase S41 [Cutibacterium avidum]